MQRRPTADEQFAAADYNAGYLAGIGCGRAMRGDQNPRDWSRGYDAGRVARWCGVSLYQGSAS